MKLDSKRLSIISLFTASACCLPTVVVLGLTVAGAGATGLSGMSSKFAGLRPYFLPLAILGLGLSYRQYFKEKKSTCQSCTTMSGHKTRLTLLIFSTLIVASFSAMSILPAFFESESLAGVGSSVTGTGAVLYDVKGMTCKSCEFTANYAVETYAKVDSVKSNYQEGKIMVWFSEERSDSAVISALSNVGYIAQPVGEAK